jgi:hypothetical protein
MDTLILTEKETGCVELAACGRTAPILVGDEDWPGVLRAAKDLAVDFARVTGSAPAVLSAADAASGAVPIPTVVIVGTLGKSACIDSLAGGGLIDSTFLSSNPESYEIAVIGDPFPGIEHALVIAGGGKRGTIFGIYELSSMIGVSPWYWWADVPPKKSAALYAKIGLVVRDAPAVRYRGIFLNDEYPALTNWVRSTYGTIPGRDDPPIRDEPANYGKDFYVRIFELILRLKGNYLWPAMWNNAFNEDDPENARLADEYGIVMGTSHQEPMIRAQKEWDRRHYEKLGQWNYAKHADTLESFWQEGIARNGAYENVVTIGLRGANDTEIAPGGTRANRAMLEHIIDRQREIISGVTGKDAAETPQLWCAYKEIQEYYEDGMRVPDDVTMLWSDDNWGNQRRLPTAEERRRAGGAGIYYHFDYHGGPRSYQWINTSPIAKVWDQMSLAREFGADRIWIVNVGHLKGYEYPLSFFMDFAWDPGRRSGTNLREFTVAWARSLFGETHAGEAAEILESLARYNSRRKPELLEPDSWSLVDYREAERIIAEWKSLEILADTLHRALPESAKDASYELLLFPVRASGLLARIYVAAGYNALWARQGRVSANGEGERVTALFADFERLMREYDSFAGGKWAHFMDQTVLGYVDWKDPPKNNIDHIPLSRIAPLKAPAMGIATEGNERAWPKDGTPELPQFDSVNRQDWRIELFNRGEGSFPYSARASEAWVTIDAPEGTVSDQKTISVSIDWKKAPAGESKAEVSVTGPDGTVTVPIRTLKIPEAELAQARGFIEANRVLAIEAEHFARKAESTEGKWTLIEGYGKTLSGMRAAGNRKLSVDSGRAGLPFLEYNAWFSHTGDATVILTLSCALNFMPGEDVTIGFSLDDEPIATLTAVTGDYMVTNENEDWNRCVAEGARKIRCASKIAKKGQHKMRVWMLSPGIVLERVTIDLGALKPSMLGPPESPLAGNRQK